MNTHTSLHHAPWTHRSVCIMNREHTGQFVSWTMNTHTSLHHKSRTHSHTHQFASWTMNTQGSLHHESWTHRPVCIINHKHKGQFASTHWGVPVITNTGQFASTHLRHACHHEQTQVSLCPHTWDVPVITNKHRSVCIHTLRCAWHHEQTQVSLRPHTETCLSSQTQVSLHPHTETCLSSRTNTGQFASTHWDVPGITNKHRSVCVHTLRRACHTTKDDERVLLRAGLNKK